MSTSQFTPNTTNDIPVAPNNYFAAGTPLTTLPQIDLKPRLAFLPAYFITVGRATPQKAEILPQNAN